MALQFDNAVTFLGNSIEGALHETKTVGRGTSERHVAKYTLTQLLDQNFRLPVSKSKTTGGVRDLANLLKSTKRGP